MGSLKKNMRYFRERNLVLTCCKKVFLSNLGPQTRTIHTCESYNLEKPSVRL